MSLNKEEIANNLQWLIDNEKKYLALVPIISFFIGGIIAYRFWK